jgi:hypothetical protein
MRTKSHGARGLKTMDTRKDKDNGDAAVRPSMPATTGHEAEAGTASIAAFIMYGIGTALTTMC